MNEARSPRRKAPTALQSPGTRSRAQSSRSLLTTWNKPGLDRLPAGALNSLSKSVFVTFQRMETPMIYFYSEAERTVNVSVRFPQGLITDGWDLRVAGRGRSPVVWTTARKW